MMPPVHLLVVPALIVLLQHNDVSFQHSLHVIPALSRDLFMRPKPQCWVVIYFRFQRNKRFRLKAGMTYVL